MDRLARNVDDLRRRRRRGTSGHRSRTTAEANDYRAAVFAICVMEHDVRFHAQRRLAFDVCLHPPQGSDLRRFVVLRLEAQLRSRVDPSDVVQETMFEAYRRLDELRNSTAGAEADGGEVATGRTVDD
jgi:hypothetical protein